MTNKARKYSGRLGLYKGIMPNLYEDGKYWEREIPPVPDPYEEYFVAGSNSNATTSPPPYCGVGDSTPTASVWGFDSDLNEFGTNFNFSYGSEGSNIMKIAYNHNFPNLLLITGVNYDDPQPLMSEALVTRNGTFLWRNAINPVGTRGTTHNGAAGAAGALITNDGKFIVGQGNRDMALQNCIRAYNEAGSILWTHQDTAKVISDIKQDATGSFIYAVNGIGTVENLMKLNSNTGAIVWQRDNPYRPFNVLIDNDGNIWTSGQYSPSPDFDNIKKYSPEGDLLLTLKFGSILGSGIVDLDGNLWYTVHVVIASGDADAAYFVIKIDTDGNRLFNNATLGPGGGITMDQDGNIYTVTNQGTSRRLYKFAPNGTILIDKNSNFYPWIKHGLTLAAPRKIIV